MSTDRDGDGSGEIFMAAHRFGASEAGASGCWRTVDIMGHGGVQRASVANQHMNQAALQPRDPHGAGNYQAIWGFTTAADRQRLEAAPNEPICAPVT